MQRLVFNLVLAFNVLCAVVAVVSAYQTYEYRVEAERFVNEWQKVGNPTYSIITHHRTEDRLFDFEYFVVPADMPLHKGKTAYISVQAEGLTKQDAYQAMEQLVSAQKAKQCEDWSDRMQTGRLVYTVFVQGVEISDAFCKSKQPTK